MYSIKQIDNFKTKLSKIIFSDFPELQIYPKEYYTNVISKYFESTKTPFAYIYGDFNKLRAINDLYGKEAGDEALKNGLKIIKNCLPNNALISRIGGDEIAIIIPNSDKEQALKYKKKIENTFKEYNKFSTGLSITLAVEDSTNHNIQELEHSTESQVSRKKNSRNPKYFSSNLPSNDSLILQTPNNISNEELKKWETLNSYINMSVENHLADIRPSKKFTYNIDDFKNEVFYLIDCLKDYLETNLKNNKSNNSISLDDSNQAQALIPASNKTILLVHSLLTNNNFSYTNLSKEDLSEMHEFMNSLLNILIKNQASNSFNKVYLKNYLANKICQSKKDYQAVFISTAGIKLSNTAFGHHFTDMRLDKTFSLVQETLNKKYTFNTDAFNFSPDDSHFIDYGGGNYLLLLPKDNSMSQDELNTIINSINSKYNSQSPESSFQVSGMKNNNINMSNEHSFLKSLRSFKELSDDTKDTLKKEAFTSITQKKAFENSISKTIDYYLRNIPKAKNDISKKKLLISNFFTSLVNQEGSYNIQTKIYKRNHQESEFSSKYER